MKTLREFQLVELGWRPKLSIPGVSVYTWMALRLVGDSYFGESNEFETFGDAETRQASSEALEGLAKAISEGD